MKKLIAALVATLFAAGTAFAQAPAPKQPNNAADSAVTAPAKKADVKKADKKSTKAAKSNKKSKKAKKNVKKSPKKATAKKAPKKSATPAE